MKYNWLYLGISSALIFLSILFISIWGLRPSIDFVGGALLEFRFPNYAEEVTASDIRGFVSELESVEVSSIQYSASNESFLMRTNSIGESRKNDVLEILAAEVSQPEEIRFESVGPILGRELLVKTAIAVLIASVLIMGYIAYQFKDRIYGVATILAMVHDVIILAGVFALLGYLRGVEVDILFVTAVLTTLSFSVHDTIVVFDRIRESVKLHKGAKFVDIINKSITETLPRSLNNSLTTIFMLAALAVLGGETIRWFVVALLVGIISGTYSSPFVSAPILNWLTNWKRRRNRLK